VHCLLNNHSPFFQGSEKASGILFPASSGPWYFTDSVCNSPTFEGPQNLFLDHLSIHCDCDYSGGQPAGGKQRPCSGCILSLKWPLLLIWVGRRAFAVPILFAKVLSLSYRHSKTI
jgi:hypothetical protein